ncbi:MAG: alpha-amylase family glycosyl hydrolase [Verrucomicrobiota bacterium]|jgi:glycosidase
MNAIPQCARPLLIAVLIGWLGAVSAVAADSGAANGVAHQAPAWLRSAVFYEVFPRNFSPAGDFKAITARLDDLKDLGVDTLWLMPIHPLGHKMKKGGIGSPYCVRDFYAVNPDYGTTNDFKELIAQAHQRGMKIIMDIVAGHTSWDSVLMAHPEFYTKDAAGKIHPPYPEWTDVAELDYANNDVRRYMIDMMSHWLRDFGVDGFRCDTAFTVPVDFWEAARAELEKINPQVAIITDSGARPALLSKAFDMDYSGNLFETLGRVMSGEQPASLLEDSWQHTQEQFSKEALHLRFTDHHNMPRATVRFGLDGALAAQALVLMLDGVPLFYNGMEVGDATESADPALFEKMPVFWQPGGRPPLRSIYRDLIKLRKQHNAFTNNDVVWLTNSAPDTVVSFLRRDAKDEYLVLINLGNRRVTASVDLPGSDGFEPVKIAGHADPVDNALPDFHLNGYGWFVYYRSISK